MTTTRGARPWHIVTFVVAAFAVLFQLWIILDGGGILDSGQGVGKGELVRRFFSYFTIQSNVLVAIATWLIIRDQIDSTVFRVLRLASLIGITVTGIVAYLLLPPSPDYSTNSLLADRLLHIAVPVLAFIGWVVFGPRGRLHLRDVLPSLIWPVSWLVATLALGPLVDWYPYPFLNVADLGLIRVL
ncbi:MAG: Pr6Pr family membrane protein, partial [Dermatophilaceae bacterium]